MSYISNEELREEIARQWARDNGYNTEDAHDFWYDEPEVGAEYTLCDTSICVVRDLISEFVEGGSDDSVILEVTRPDNSVEYWRQNRTRQSYVGLTLGAFERVTPRSQTITRWEAE